MNKLLTVITVTIGVISMTMTTAFASEYDIDNMTPDEMKEAIITLESEKAELEDQVKDLKVQLFDLQQGAEETSETAAETEVLVEETEAEKVLKTTEEFLEDIVASYDKRTIMATRYSEAERNAMTYDETARYRVACAQEEQEFLDEYRNAEFEDLNIQYLCNRYILGIDKQIGSLSIWEDTQDYTKFNDQYTSGYYNRAYVIVELSDYYGVSFGDIVQMKADTEAMDAENSVDDRNSAVDSATVKHVQELLNEIGFPCGNADGIAGLRTMKIIQRFQEMYGYDPIDGMIDDELIGQLEEVAAQKAPVDETEIEG